jgi:N-acetylglutamate synthase-like GNAT family acetyltransferase
MNPTVRRAHEQDIPELARLVAALAASDCIATNEPRLVK